jgi:hypothetical protein
MDFILCLRQAARLQSMELERVEDVRGLRSSSRAWLWFFRRDSARSKNLVPFELGLADTALLRFQLDPAEKY